LADRRVREVRGSGRRWQAIAVKDIQESRPALRDRVRYAEAGVESSEGISKEAGGFGPGVKHDAVSFSLEGDTAGGDDITV
jgi:hypothetical protein